MSHVSDSAPSRPIKLGIIGTGIASRNLHWPALRGLRDKFDVVAVCNRSEVKAQRFSELTGGVPFCLDYREILADPEIEAVDVALPFHLNLEVVRSSIEAGKHVIFEKPVAASMSEAKELTKRIDASTKVTMVAENYRYHPTFRRLRELVDEGAIGRPYAVFWDDLSALSEANMYVNTAWRTSEPYPGGFIVDGGVHNVAGLREIFGDLKVVSARATSVNKNLGKIDGLSAMFETDAGVVGHLNLYVSAVGSSHNALRILGTRGSLLARSYWHLTVTDNDGVVSEDSIPEDWGYVGEFEDFFQAVRHGRPPKGTVGEAYRDLEFIMRALAVAGPTVDVS